MRTKAIDVNVEELRTSKVLCREKANELEGSWNKKDIASRHLKWKNIQCQKKLDFRFQNASW